METAQFWRKSYDPGLTDLDPREWETSYVEADEPLDEGTHV